MLTNTKGLVIRETDVGDRDKILTLLTDTCGKISISCKGARSLRSRSIACTQLLCYCDWTLYRGRTMYSLNEAELTDNFFNIRLSVEGYALAAYMCEVAGVLSTENGEDSELLRLMLNTLFLLNRGDRPLYLIKGGFELRAAAQAGFQPDLVGCAVCGRDIVNTDDVIFFSPDDGMLLCGECRRCEPDPAAFRTYGQIAREVAAAMRHVVYSPAQKIFAFSLVGPAQEQFARVCERFLLYHAETEFRTLEFYKGLGKM